MGSFFNWCDVQVVIPCIRSFLAEHSHIPVDFPGVLGKDMLARNHMNSDMKQIARVIEYAFMK